MHVGWIREDLSSTSIKRRIETNNEWHEVECCAYLSSTSIKRRIETIQAFLEVLEIK